MKNFVVTILLACFVAVHGCASPKAPSPGADGDSGEGAQTESTENAPMSEQGALRENEVEHVSPSDAGDSPETAGAAATTPAGTDGSTSPETPAATPTPASPGASVAQSEEAKPVNASATEKESVSTLSPQSALLKPALARDRAPDVFKVKFATTNGDFVIEAHRSWAPNGVDRLYNLVKIGFFTDVAFFRVMKNFVVQFGIHGDPEVSAAWLEATIEDDKVVESNTRGMVSFADRRLGNTRTTQLFINLADMNNYLNEEGYAPVAKVIEGMEVVGSLYEGYGDGAPRGPGPNQATIQSQGNEYLKREFPELDYIKNAAIIE